jgi:hypothetical protein
MSDTKEPKTARKGALIALGIICIILVACLVGVVTAYTVMTNSTVANLQKQVASDNSTIDLLKSLVTNLQSRLLNTVEGVNEQLGLQLTMTLETTSYSLFDPMTIYFTITNISNQTVYLDSYGDAFDMYEFQVYNDTNNIVWSQIYPVYNGINPGGPMITNTTLSPKESLIGSLEWEEMSNDTVPVPVSPGTYYIVGQIGPIFMNGLTIETTPIQITIT